MRVLVGCEFSQIVTNAFRRRGHAAWSCDLLPTEGDPRYHLQCDIFDVLDGGWDMLIFHWPCTRLCNSGVRWLSERNLWKEMRASAMKFRDLMDCNIPYICGENPIPHKYAREIMGNYNQLIQPWMFGHRESKATCLWLKRLQKLKPTKIETERIGRVWKEPPGPDRWKNRSRFFSGIAEAMAEQWG